MNRGSLYPTLDDHRLMKKSRSLFDPKDIWMRTHPIYSSALYFLPLEESVQKGIIKHSRVDLVVIGRNSHPSTHALPFQPKETMRLPTNLLECRHSRVATVFQKIFGTGRPNVKGSGEERSVEIGPNRSITPFWYQIGI